MNRRMMICSMAATAIVTPLAAFAQGKVKARIGWLAVGPIPSNMAAFRAAMQRRGYVEGQNLVLQERYANTVAPIATTSPAEAGLLPTETSRSTSVRARWRGCTAHPTTHRRGRSRVQRQMFGRSLVYKKPAKCEKLEVVICAVEERRCGKAFIFVHVNARLPRICVEAPC